MLNQNQKDHLDIVSENGTFTLTDTFVPYTFGEIGPYFAQSAAVMKSGVNYNKVINDMALLARNCLAGDFVVSGGETRDWIFSNPVATILGLPSTMIYKDKTMIGAEVKDKNVVHVADLNNEGSSPKDMWVPAIRGAEGRIEHICFYIDRCESDSNIFRNLGVEPHALISLNGEAWDYLMKKGVVSQAFYANVRRRMEDKGVWAREMLRSSPGLDTLAGLFNNEKDAKKARKIIEVGYPDLREELTAHLQRRGISI